MGCLYEFNWILKLPSVNRETLVVGKQYSFEKNGIRIYPINIPIDLVNDNWEAIARCVISTISISSCQTTGEYKILEVYDEKRSKVFSEQWRKVLKYTISKDTIEDYRTQHIT